MAIRRFARQPSFRHRLKTLFGRRTIYWGLIGGGVFLLYAAGVILWWSKDLPDPKNIDARRIAESTRIYDRTGTHLLYEIGEVHRTTIPLEQISPFIRQATLAIEDDKFYEHHGIAFTGLIRGVVLKPLKGQRAQGGSTITQQLIKNSILTPERTLRRKVKEAVLALELEQRFSKDEIFTMYLNDIPYGSQAYGVEAAAQTFFGTSASNVTLAQAAILAALPQAPSYYSPYGSHFEDLKQRQEYVLERMQTLGMITPQQAQTAQQEQIAFQPRREAITAPHFVFYIKELLDEQYGQRLVEQGGLKVITTLDTRLQTIAEEALKNRQEELRKQGISNASLVAIDPKTGDILAMVGSIDYFNEDIDGNVNVAIRHRSPGSSIKPFVYAAAWEKGYTPETILVDAETDFGQGYKPRNFTLKDYGPVSMRTALANSLNISAVQTLYLAGIKNATDLAQKMGMTSLNDPERYGLSLVLGGGEVRLVDEVSAYGVFAAEGMRRPHRALLKAEKDNEVLFDAGAEDVPEEQVIDKDVARLVSNVLSDNGARALTFGARSALQLGSRPVAAKTGTTQEFRDGWTVGYTPSLAAGVWVGNNDNTPMKAREPGALTAAPIWNEFMRKALTGTPIEQFTPPPPRQNIPHGVLRGETPEIKAKWDPVTKTAYSVECPIDIGQPRTFKEIHSILWYVQRTNPLGAAPSDPQRDPQFARWEAAVAAWRDKYNAEHQNNPADPLYVDSLPLPTCEISNAEDVPKVRIVEPNTTILRDNPVRVAVEIDSVHPLKEVRFLLEGQEIGRTGGSGPFEAAFSYPPNFSGRKTLVVHAVTENNLVGRANRTFIINPDDSAPSVTLHTPPNGLTLQPTSFPYTVKVTATDPSGIDIVDVLYRRQGSAATQRIARITTQAPRAPNRYEAAWGDSPGPGTYDVFAVAYDKTGNTTESARAQITIE
jgi:penicillin-binding protein 1C